MLLLAFETSAKAASVALFEGNTLLAEQYQNTGLTHSQTLLVMAEDLLKQCGKTAQQVQGVAVANGPGSFTGVRIGVARRGAHFRCVHSGSHGFGAGCFRRICVPCDGCPSESGV